uniref:Uncharacterized protein n=1 Tax=Amblyomma triste TaxID=251400 RepID=A0A023G0E4_AMBTT
MMSDREVAVPPRRHVVCLAALLVFLLTRHAAFISRFPLLGSLNYFSPFSLQCFPSVHVFLFILKHECEQYRLEGVGVRIATYGVAIQLLFPPAFLILPGPHH